MTLEHSRHIRDILPKSSPLSDCLRWTVCVGAGTSVPIFPSWKEFSTGLLVDLDEKLTDSDLAGLLEVYSLGTLIGAAYASYTNANSHDVHLDLEFDNILRWRLYERIRRDFGGGDKFFADFSDIGQKIVTALGSENLGKVSPSIWKTAYSELERKYPQCSAFHIARAICDSVESGRAPRAILTFNAEPLLSFCCNAEYAVRQATVGHGPQSLVSRHMGAVSSVREGRIPCVFCHGYLVPPHGYLPSIANLAASKLVFGEAEYQTVANQAWSWQSSAFTAYASQSSVIFAGLSMSDPNLRRWLIWINDNRLAEINTLASDVVHFSLPHWSIQKYPESASMAEWAQACLLPLGVRILWIDTWDQVGEAIRKLLGI